MRRKLTEQEKLVARLEDWGNYVKNIRPHIGWNVNPISFGEEPTNFQKRNDVYSDPVHQEYKRMAYDQRRDMATDAAVKELPRLMRDMIYAQYVRWPESSVAYIACQLGKKRASCSRALTRAHDKLPDIIEGLRYQSHNAA